MSTAPLAVCDGAARTYGTGPSATVALMETDCAVAPGDRIALVGRSGSGKSTLLHLLAGLDEPTVGTVSWPALGPAEELRPGPVAMIFQGPSLLPPLTVLENVMLPLAILGWTERKAEPPARAGLERLGLGGLANKLPEELSGGQLQRVAVARALVGEPRLILADEPTGQLDHPTAREVIAELIAAAEAAEAALIVATHDLEIASRFEVRWDIESGRLRAGHATGLVR